MQLHYPDPHPASLPQTTPTFTTANSSHLHCPKQHPPSFTPTHIHLHYPKQHPPSQPQAAPSRAVESGFGEDLYAVEDSLHVRFVLVLASGEDPGFLCWHRVDGLIQA